MGFLLSSTYKSEALAFANSCVNVSFICSYKKNFTWHIEVSMQNSFCPYLDTIYPIASGFPMIHPDLRAIVKIGHYKCIV